MSIIGHYCEDCGELVAAEDTSSGEVEYTNIWCGVEREWRCFSCHDPFNIEFTEVDDE